MSETSFSHLLQNKCVIWQNCLHQHMHWNSNILLKGQKRQIFEPPPPPPQKVVFFAQSFIHTTPSPLTSLWSPTPPQRPFKATGPPAFTTTDTTACVKTTHTALIAPDTAVCTKARGTALTAPYTTNCAKAKYTTLVAPDRYTDQTISGSSCSEAEGEDEEDERNVIV